MRDYSHRAHGTANANSEAAWAILKDTAFTGQHEGVPAYVRAPSLRVGGEPPYSNERLVQAWGQLLGASALAGASDAYRFDLVAVTRQVLGNFSAELQRPGSLP